MTKHSLKWDVGGADETVPKFSKGLRQTDLGSLTKYQELQRIHLSYYASAPLQSLFEGTADSSWHQEAPSIGRLV
jgi:hypothetical protein